MTESRQEWRVDVDEACDLDADTVLATISTRLVLVCVLARNRLLRVRAYSDRAEAVESARLRAC